MLKRIKDNLYLISPISFTGTLAGAIVVLVAPEFNADTRFLQSISFVVTVVSLIVFIVITFFVRDTKKQSKLFTFITNNLLPNKSEEYLVLDTYILVIEDGKTESYFSKYKNEFKKLIPEDDKKTEQGDENTEQKVKNTEVGVNFLSFNKYHSLSESEKIKSLENKLSKADSVILVRTLEMEKMKWVYDTLENWAKKNSQIPCLIIDKLDFSQLKSIDLDLIKAQLNPVTKKYFFIHAETDEEKQSLPWYLTQRASERLSLWRDQATTNRMIALLFISLFFSLATVYLTSNNYFQLRDNYENVRIIYKEVANETKEFYAENIIKCNDGDLHISYWIGYKNALLNYGDSVYQLNTSEKKPDEDRTVFDRNNKYIIGSAFLKPNSIVKGEKGQDIKIAPIETFTFSDCKDCQLYPEDHRKINKIICSSFNATSVEERTVGICIDTKNETDIFSHESLKFLRDRTKEFYNAISPLLNSHQIIPKKEQSKNKNVDANLNGNITNTTVNSNNNINANSVCINSTNSNNVGNNRNISNKPANK